MAVIENSKRVRVFSTRITEELHGELTAYAEKHRRSLSSAGKLLMEDALHRALEEDIERAG